MFYIIFGLVVIILSLYLLIESLISPRGRSNRYIVIMTSITMVLLIFSSVLIGISLDPFWSIDIVSFILSLFFVYVLIEFNLLIEKTVEEKTKGIMYSSLLITTVMVVSSGTFLIKGLLSLAAFQIL